MSGKSQLERAAGKLITGRVSGLSLDAETERAIADGIVSGVTLFKDNARDLNQLFDLVWQMRFLGGDDFLVAVDQEGGGVQRFDEVLTPLPSPMALAALHDERRALESMSTAAGQLHLLGVNCNLAPVLDVNSNPMNPIIGTRAFGDKVEPIIAMAQLCAQAHKQHHVLPVAKHFPGHGDSFEDSHLNLAVAAADREELARREFKPFAECVSDFEAMLIGHIWLKAYDKDPLPASLSRCVIEDLLRNQLHFNGYLFTDDMPVMKAIVDNYGLEEACVLAVAAGADNVLVSGSLEQINAVHRALVKALESGHIKEDRLAQSLSRRKSALSVTASAVADKGDARQELAASIERACDLMRDLSADAITAVAGQVPKLSAAGGQWVVVAPQHPRYRLDLYEQLKSQGGGQEFQLSEVRFELNPGDEEIEKIAVAVAGKNCVLVTFRALLNDGQLRLAERLWQVCQDKKRIAVASDVPYELALLGPTWETALATFDPSNLAMQALALLLWQGLPARGKMPVSLVDVQKYSRSKQK